MSSPIRKIIIVDDHEAIRRGVRQLVETTPNFQVVGEAGDGRMGLELAKEVQPDIAIIDYSLPSLNGLDLAHALKKELPRIEMLLYTMHDREEIVIYALQNGVRSVLLKSDRGEELIAALNALALQRPYFSATVSEALLDRILRSKSPAQSSSLTHRERVVVQHVAEGCLNKQIAARLNVTVKTVETHRASAMRKLKLQSTAALVRYAVRNLLIQP